MALFIMLYQELLTVQGGSNLLLYMDEILECDHFDEATELNTLYVLYNMVLTFELWIKWEMKITEQYFPV